MGSDSAPLKVFPTDSSADMMATVIFIIENNPCVAIRKRKNITLLSLQANRSIHFERGAG